MENRGSKDLEHVIWVGIHLSVMSYRTLSLTKFVKLSKTQFPHLKNVNKCIHIRIIIQNKIQKCFIGFLASNIIKFHGKEANEELKIKFLILRTRKQQHIILEKL